MYTLKQVENILRDICNDHPQVKAVTDLAKLGDEGHKHLECPYIAFDVLDVMVNGRVSYNFYIASMTSIEEDKSDIREAQGDTTQILVDIITNLEDQGLLDQDTDIILTPAEDNQNARVGYTMQEYLHSSRQQCNVGG